MYPLCHDGLCLNRLRDTCELWHFVRKHVVDRVWSEPLPNDAPRGRQLSINGNATDAPPTSPSAPPRRKVVARVGNLWEMGLGALGMEKSGSRANTPPPSGSPRSSTPTGAFTLPSSADEGQVSPVKERRRLPPPPPPLRTMTPPPPLPPRRRGATEKVEVSAEPRNTFAGDVQDSTVIQKPSSEESPSTSERGQSPEVSDHAITEVKNTDAASEGSPINGITSAKPTSEADAPAHPSETESQNVTIVPDGAETPTSEKSGGFETPPEAPASIKAQNAEDVNTHPADNSIGADLPVSAPTTTEIVHPVAPPPPLPRRAAARDRPRSTIVSPPPLPPRAPSPRAETPPAEPTLGAQTNGSDTMPVNGSDEPALTSVADKIIPSPDDALNQVSSPMERESTPEPTTPTTPIVPAPTPSHLDVLPDEEGAATNSPPRRIEDASLVGDSTWEERGWKELIRLRENMFWARVGALRDEAA